MNSAFIKNDIDREAIKTKDISITEEYNYENNIKKRIGYKAHIQMEIEQKLSDNFINNILTSLQHYSLKVNYSISFKLSEDQKEKLRNEAIKGAMNDAISKAKLISESANIELGKIHRISFGKLENWNYGRQDADIVIEQMMPLTRMDPNPENGIDFNPKEVSIRKVIEVEWHINN